MHDEGLAIGERSGIAHGPRIIDCADLNARLEPDSLAAPNVMPLAWRLRIDRVSDFGLVGVHTQPPTG